MDPTEIQARATIAAALIVAHAVDIPAIPKPRPVSTDPAALRLRELTDYVYKAIISDKR
jgi:hypothetical protein